MEELKFTKEIKEKWLASLRSGKYVQGVGQLLEKVDNVCKHCCLGVLADIHEDLKITESGMSCSFKDRGRGYDIFF